MISRITSYDEYKREYERSINDPENFWSDVAQGFHWKEKWQRVRSGGFDNVDYKWFEGAKLNISENCLDVHLKSQGEKAAIIWEPNNPEEKKRTLTYRELHKEVCRFANVLHQLGINK